MFVICGALRLARFNVQSNVEPNYFKGLPIPAAATFTASLVLFSTFLGGLPESRHVLIIVLIYILSFLMVSTIEYPSFKELELKKQKPFNVLVATILILMVIVYKPRIMLFSILALYIASGPVITVYRHRKKRVVTDTSLKEPSPAERE
jgi:CDP-diacylglycerol--serine O-phosphatidyltransferase